MTMEEVNERFPLTKYKAWMTTRAEEGLPTAGGIAAAPSRAASIKNEEGTIEKHQDSTEATTSTAVVPLSTSETASTDNETAQHGTPEVLPSDDPLDEANSVSAKTASDHRPSTAKSVTPHVGVPLKPESTGGDAEAGEDDDQIQTAIPTEQLPDPGDACAICLDTIEEDDDIRGLTCGHAFHASCVDPWLTSRRACCPLCKADYYVPKPRPEGADAESTGRRSRGNMPAPPQYAFMGAGRGGSASFSGRRPSMVLPGRFMTIMYNENDRYGFPQVVREPRPSRAERRALRRASNAAFTDVGASVDAAATQENQGATESRSWRRRLLHPMEAWQRERAARIHGTGNDGRDVEGENTSPAQLEAGRA